MSSTDFSDSEKSYIARMLGSCEDNDSSSVINFHELFCRTSELLEEKCSDSNSTDFDIDDSSHCCICGRDLWPHDEDDRDDDDPYTNDTPWNVYGGLRCVYCFNTFCHRSCTFSFSPKTYVAKLRHRSWSCAACVPSFTSVATALKEEDDDETWSAFTTLVLQVFLMLYHLYLFVYWGGPCFGLIEFIFMLSCFGKAFMLFWYDLT